MVVENDKNTVRPARIAYNFFILVLTLYSLVVVTLMLILDLAPSTYNSLLGLDILISLIFLFDFGHQFYRASSKKAYLTSTGWLELLGCVPGVPLLRYGRLARLISVSRALREKTFRQMLVELRQDRAGAAFLFVVLFGLIALTLVSSLVMAFERNAPGANITSFADAVWWAIVTTATVGYGDYFPVTAYGRLLSIILMVFGIGIFGLLASSLASWFLSPQSPEQHPADKADIAGLQDEIANLRQEIQQLQAAIDFQKPPAATDHRDNEATDEG